MGSKQVTDRGRSARKVTAAANEHAERAAKGIEDRLRPHLAPGETMPDVRLLVLLAGRAVEGTFSHLARADDAHENELGDDAGPRQQRDRHAEEVSSVLSELRDVGKVAFDPVVFARLGLVAPIYRAPDALVSTGQSVLSILKDESVELPTGKLGIIIDRQTFAKRIEAPLNALKAALDDVAKEEREAETTLKDKHHAMQQHDSAFTKSAAWLRATFNLADLEDLAAKVRPSRRRLGRTHEEASDGSETPETDG